MHKEILRSIAGVGLFPVVSLLLFMGVFALAVIRALRMDRGEVQHLAGLPLDAPAGSGAPDDAEVRS
jgi:hypothetical protein